LIKQARAVFDSVGNLLKNLPKRSKTPDVILALYVRSAFDEAIGKTCGDLPEKVRVEIRAVSFKNKTLTVAAPRIVSTELQMRSNLILKNMNGILGRRAVFRIRFKNQ